MIEFSQDYAFTVTFNRKFQELTTDQQYRKMDPWLYNYMLAYGRQHRNFTKVNMKITMVFELTSNANIHAHGIIRFPTEWLIKDINIYFRDMFRSFCTSKTAFGVRTEENNNKFFGFVNIKPCEQFDGWLAYLTKSLGDFTKATGHKPIVADDLACFDAETILNYHS